MGLFRPYLDSSTTNLPFTYVLTFANFTSSSDEDFTLSSEEDFLFSSDENFSSVEVDLLDLA